MNSTKTTSLLVPTVAAESAQALVQATAATAEELGKQMVIAVCDTAGVLKAFLRMDDAPFLAVGIAQDKAYTAAGFGLSTADWHEFIKEDPPLADGIVHTPRLVVFGGGYPLKENGRVIGGLGVSGGHYSDDMKCALGGLEALGFPVD
jgi:uncharacterized protein GlcG (DUF336 family)